MTTNLTDIPWYSVESSNVKRVRWQPTRKTRTTVYGTLHVEMTWGGVYEYHDVTAQRWARLLSAESIGRYVNRRIAPLQGSIVNGQ